MRQATLTQLPLFAAPPPSRAPDRGGALQQRFAVAGAGALTDAELLQLLLARHLDATRAERLAVRLLADFGSFAAVLNAPATRLRHTDGLPEAAVPDLRLVAAMTQRLAHAQVINRPVLSGWDALLAYCRVTMGHEPVETFRILFLDRKNTLIGTRLQARGTLDHVPVYPREVVKQALEANAAALILVHNHPSGDPTPSEADIDMTRRIAAALDTVGITLHDHLVIGQGCETGFRQLGLL